MRNWIRHIDGLIGNLIIFNWRHHLQKTAQQWSDEELAEKLKNIPSKERQEAWLRVARKPYTEEEREDARAKLRHALLDRMEHALKAFRLAGRQGLLDRGYRGGAVCKTDRGGDRAGRNYGKQTSPRDRVVDQNPGPPRLRAGEDRLVPEFVGPRTRKAD